MCVTHINRTSDALQRSKRDHLLEEVEQIVSCRCMREIRDGRVSRPRDDRNEKYTDEKRASDAVEHQEDGKEPVLDGMSR